MSNPRQKNNTLKNTTVKYVVGVLFCLHVNPHLKEPLEIDLVLLLFLMRQKYKNGLTWLNQYCSVITIIISRVFLLAWQRTCSHRFWNMSFSFWVIIFHCLLHRTILSVLGTSFMFTISSAQYKEYPFLRDKSRSPSLRVKLPHRYVLV